MYLIPVIFLALYFLMDQQIVDAVLLPMRRANVNLPDKEMIFELDLNSINILFSKLYRYCRQ